MPKQNHGEFKNGSIGLDMAAGGDISPPPTPPALQTPATPLSPNFSDIPETPMSLVLTNTKGKLTEFCSKNKLPLPDFKRRQGTVQGAYATELSWTPAGDETERYVITATKQTKKDAENTAAAEMFSRIQGYISTNRQVEVGNSKRDLQQLIAKHNLWFGMPDYDTRPIGMSLFSCTLCVGDLLYGQKYTTSGKGVRKKTAEKEASGIMLDKLTEVLSCSPKEEMAPLDKLEFRLKQFPDYSIGWGVIESNNLSYFLRKKCLFLRKEGAHDLILGYSIGETDEQAAEICVQSILPHLYKLENFLLSVPQEQLEEANK